MSDLEITRVGGSPVLQLERAGRPVSSRLVLELRQRRTCPSRVARLDAVWIRYSVPGGRHEQRVPLDPPAVRPL